MANVLIGSKLYNSPYILDKFIAEGGMNSKVYLCHDPKFPTKKLIAKIISFVPEGNQNVEKQLKEFHEIYRKESVTSLRLFGKPNIVQTYEHFQGDDNTEVIVQDYVEGTDLRYYLEKKGVLTPRVALSIFKQILIGVEAMHHLSHQIIHCDLKPENIIVSKDLSKITIIDFGISSVLEISKEKQIINRLTDNQGHGTEGYVSPDIFKNVITVQYDFYSLGAILYRMLMSSFPFKKIEHNEEEFKKMSPEQQARAEQKRVKRTVLKPLTYDMINISANPTIPVALENLIFRCLACKQEDLKYRYNDISEIMEDVDKIIYEIDHQINDSKLLKPLQNRNYEVPDNLVVTRLKERNPIYQQWWFFCVIVGSALALITSALIVFLVIR